MNIYSAKFEGENLRAFESVIIELDSLKWLDSRSHYPIDAKVTLYSAAAAEWNSSSLKCLRVTGLQGFNVEATRMRIKPRL
jgi:hypothetical protein